MPLILQNPPELQVAARKQFLDAIKIHAPSVLVSLANDVFPIWEQLSSIGYNHPEYLNSDDFVPTQTRNFIKFLIDRFELDTWNEVRLLSRNLEGLIASLARFKDEPSEPQPDGTVRITIRFVPCPTIVEQSHPLHKVLSILKPLQHMYYTALIIRLSRTLGVGRYFLRI